MCEGVNSSIIKITEYSGEEAAALARDVLQVNMQVWLSTYPNPALGITEDDVKAKFTDFDKKAEKNRDYYLEGKDRRQWYAFDRDKLVGYCLAQVDECVGKINSIYILEEYQGRGIGGMLIAKALEYMRDVPIEVECAKHNTPTIQFYEKHGFQVVEKDYKSFTFPSGSRMPLIKMRRDSDSN